MRACWAFVQLAPWPSASKLTVTLDFLPLNLSLMRTMAFLNASAPVPEFHAMTLRLTAAPPTAGAAAAGAVVAAAAAGAVVAAGAAAGAVVAAGAAAAGAVVAAGAGAAGFGASVGLAGTAVGDGAA